MQCNVRMLMSEWRVVEVVQIIVKTSLCNVFSDSQQCCIEVPPADHATNILNNIFVISDMSFELNVRCD